MTLRLGVDIGGVLIERHDDDDDTSFFGDNYLQTPPVPDAFKALRLLGEQRFGEHVYLVSKCGEHTAQRTREWLAEHDFYAATGVAEDRVHFCRHRADKADIARRLGLTDFVDDRVDVLGFLSGVVERRWLLGDGEAPPPADVRQVRSWPDAVATLLAETEGR